MGRRPRSRDYDEEDDYESEHDAYRPPPRSSRGHYEGREPVHARRHSIPPPIEKMERLRVRDHPRPPRFRDPFDRRSAPSPEDDIGVPPDEVLQGFEEHRNGNRRRYGRRVPQKLDPGDEWMSQRGSGEEFFGSESEGERFRRRSTELRRRHLRSQEDFVPHRRVRHSVYERSDRGHEPDRPVGDIRRARSGPRYPIFSRTRPKSGYHTDLEDNSDDGSDDRHQDGRPRLSRRRFDSEHDDQEGLSSAESEGSGESLAGPMPPFAPSQHLRVSEAYYTRRPPRAPSPEVSFGEPRVQLREERGPQRRKEIIIEPRDNHDIPPSVQVPLPEDHIRQTRETTSVPRSSAEALGHDREVLVTEVQSNGRDGFKEREVLEEVLDERAHPKGGPLSAAEEMAIVNAVNRSRHSPRDSSQETSSSRHRERNPKLPENEKRPSEDDSEIGRGKVGRRYVGVKDKRERLWTEITKDLVVKEAIERAGYEYEETVSSYYIFSYLKYEDVSALVEMSENIRVARRRRIQEIHNRRRASMPPPRALRDERATSPRRHRYREGRRMMERDVIDDPRGRANPERW